MNRRGFLSSILAFGAAPAIVRAESIMRIRPIVLPGDAEFEAIARGNQFATFDEITRESLRILEEVWYLPGTTVRKSRRTRGRV